MTRANEIIVSLLQSDEFNNCMKKVKPSLKEDLRSELSLILLETAPEKIVHLFNNHQLTFYTVRIILRLAFSKTSPFYKKYRLIHEEYKDTGVKDDDDLVSRTEREAQEDKALASIKCLYWYNDEMVQLYVKEGTFRAMHKITKIPVTTCQNVVKGSLDSVKNHHKTIQRFLKV
jgi:hypothetical protein